MAADEMRRHPETGFTPVAFVDDDPQKIGTEVAGLPVVGSRADIPRALHERSIDEVLIALPSARGAAIRGGAIVQRVPRNRLAPSAGGGIDPTAVDDRRGVVAKRASRYRRVRPRAVVTRG